ncbi:MAG: serine/threonine protein kinase, bacterial, partial [Mycobacterium sp.]|nr:serine/threonine protein kinase, bacterial [Mycobacterium sp.]
DRFVGVQDVVAGRNPAHRISVRPGAVPAAAYDGRVAAAASDDPLEGALLDGRYRVATKIATGGTSTVYRGLDTRLERPVALKVMDSRYSGDQQFLTRFQLEARSVARLKDPGLVAVYDQGLDARHPFLVMELVEGGTLRELLAERGPMPPHAVAAVLRPVLGGLAAAHRAGLVHRDVKPENVLISDQGEVKIVDFGLVRAVAEAGITSASVILGTAAYLSPEQVKDGNAGPRSDVYATGIVAYELLTGQTPFSGDTALSVAYQRLDTDVPPPSSVISGVPSQFDELVQRATSRDPASRYADAHDMGVELDAIVDALHLPDFRVPSPRNSAQHRSAGAPPSQTDGNRITDPRQPAAIRPPIHQPTRQLTRDLRDWPAAPTSHGGEYRDRSRQFAGIDLVEFSLERQHSRRMILIWVAIVLSITGMVAAAAWTVGSNIGGLL